MSKNASPQSAARLLFTFIVIAYALFSASQGDWFMVQCMVGAALVGAVVLIVMYPLNLKRVLVTVYSSFSHHPAKIDDFPQLDLPELERLTAEWEALGFVHYGDFEGRSLRPRLGTSFSRVFEHQTEGAIAELLQQFTTTKALPMTSLVQSFWGQRERVEHYVLELQRSTAPIANPTSSSSQQEAPSNVYNDMWTLVTHNLPSNRYFPVLRQPRTLGGRLEVGSSPAQIWQVHQQRAALVEARLGMSALHDNLPLLLRAYGRLINQLSARRIKSTPALTLARYSLNRKPSPPFYDGELAPLSQ